MQLLRFQPEWFCHPGYATIWMGLGGYGSAGEQPERPGSTVDRAEIGFPFSALFCLPYRWSEKRKTHLLF